MALESTINRKVFTASAAQSLFSFGDILYFDQEDLKVYVDGELLVLGDDYAVSPTTNTPDGTPGGSVTINGTMVGGEQVIILRQVELVQEIDYQEFGKFPANTQEQGLDYLTMIAQQHEEKINRALVLPVTEDGDEDIVTLPALADRVSKYFVWDANGAPSVGGAPTDTSLTTAFTESLLAQSSASDILVLIRDNLSVATLLADDWEIITRDPGNANWKKVTLDLVRGKALTKNSNTGVTTKDFVIPAGVKRVTIMFDAVSLSGTDSVLVQLGANSSIQTTSYVSRSGAMNDAGATAVATSTAGLVIAGGNAAHAYTGKMTIDLLDTATNDWIESHNLIMEDSATVISGAGRKTLGGSATLQTVRITTTGSNTFDAGTVNVWYEF